MREPYPLPEGWVWTPLLDAVGGNKNLIVGGPFGSNLKVSDYREDGVPIIRLQNIDFRMFRMKGIRYISEKKANELQYHSFVKGDIVLAKLGDPIGKSCLVPDKLEYGIVVSDVVRIRNQNNILINKYLIYYLNSPYSIGQLNRQVFGTTRPRVNLNKIRDLHIPLPPLPTQKKIVAILEKAEQIKRLQTEVEPLYDELIKSIFVEMFCNNIQRDNWNIHTIKELAEDKMNSMRTGPFGSNLLHSEFVDSGISVLGIDNVVKNRFRWEERRYITKEKYQQLVRYTIHPDDVLITIMGTIGKSCVVPNGIPTSINTKHLAAITLNQSKCLPEFLSKAFQYHPSILSQIIQANRGAIMAGLNLTIIKSIKFRIPPIETQNSFITILGLIEKYHSFQSLRIENINIVFNSLLQKAFKGELVK